MINHNITADMIILIYDDNSEIDGNIINNKYQLSSSELD